VQQSQGFPKDSQQWLVRAGLLDHVTADVAQGQRWVRGLQRRFSTSESGDSLDKQIVDFDVAATWDATPKLSFEATARNGMQPAAQYDRNTKVLYGRLSGRFVLRNR